MNEKRNVHLIFTTILPREEKKKKKPLWRNFEQEK